MPTVSDFAAEVRAQIGRAKRQGRPHVEINAGELHRLLGGYPAQGQHSMPSCCGAMRDAMRPEDIVVFETDSGFSASLTIRYQL
jgi:hypothetical protein